jgi:hypothetical protein
LFLESNRQDAKRPKEGNLLQSVFGGLGDLAVQNWNLHMRLGKIIPILRMLDEAKARMSSRAVRGVGLALILISCSTAPAAVLDRIGVMGDSLSSEYVGGLNTQDFFGNSYLPYMSWIEQLVDDRALNFGPYGNWGGNVREGYFYNQASVFSVDTARLLSTNQHTNLALQNPTLAVLGVGGNDFLFHARDHNLPPFLFGGSYDGQSPSVIVAGALSRITTAVDTIAGPPGSPTGVAMVLCTVPDLTITPVAQQAQSFFFPGTFAQYRPAILSLNNGIRQLATQRGLALADLQLELDALLAPGGVPVSHLTIEGMQFPLGPSDPQTNADLFLVDGFHPSTILHGRMANLIAGAINTTYGTNIPLLSDVEILTNAGIVPEPQAMILAVGGICWATWRGRRSRQHAKPTYLTFTCPATCS